MVGVDKRGWIRIVEAFVAILLVVGILLVVVGEDFLGKEDASSEIHEMQLAVLRDIQVEESLRTVILGAGDTTPDPISNRINSEIPSYLECDAKICGLDENTCELDNYPEEKDIYVQSVAITDPAGVSSKQLKLFCWRE